ncbi:MAG: acyl carrier protein [Chloroflexi bacterium]|nr:acyl carrier protein [Chloroflexota bacterium]MCY3913042.1 acyl carrier protein [Chloroflexota bacterium]MCY4114663.1 acyl carrier protein [Chloroflexota bacterium]
MATFERVVAVIADKLDIPAEDIGEESKFVEDLNADSLDQVELIMALEDEYDITIPDEDAQKIVSVKDALDYIDTNVESG